MSRRNAAEKRPVLPDPQFNNRLATMMVARLMKHGKKSTAQRILSDRPLSGFKEKRELLSHPELLNINMSNAALNNVKLDSSFYQLTVEVDNYDFPYLLRSYFEILESGKVKIYKRSIGTI